MLMTKLHKLWPHYWKKPPQKKIRSRWHWKHKRRCKTAAHMCFVLCRGFSWVSIVPSPSIWPLGDAFLTASCVFVIRKSEGIVQSRAVGVRTWSSIHSLKTQLSEPLHPPPLSAMTHTPLQQQDTFFFFSPNLASRLNTNITNVLSFVWRERESPAAERAENKNTYVTSPLAEAKKKGAPPICFALRSEALWVVLARPLWGSRQSNNNEGGFGENKARKCFWSENTTAPT